MLLTMLLTVALMTIAALAVVPDMIFELKRDQEAEMIHRGVQYSRAIRTYYRKFGRYPTRLEDLENTNNLRYLRKRYKDPLTGKDFKLLHFGDPGLQLGGSFGGGVIPGATAAGAAMNGSSSSNGSSFGSSFGSSNSGGFGGSSFGSSGSSFGNNGVNSNGVFSQSSSSSFGGSSSGGFGSNPNSNSNAQSTSAQTNSSSTDTSTPGVEARNPQDADASSGGQQVIASGPIVGVASISKNKTIREYNHKKKYNEWQFLYDPTADMGGLITTPYQPPLQGMTGGSLQPAQNGTQPGSSMSGSPFGNSSGSGFGQSSFGQSSGFGQSPGFGQSSGFGSPNSSGSNPPPSSPQQQ